MSILSCASCSCLPRQFLSSAQYMEGMTNNNNDTVASHLSRTAMGRSACFALARPPPHAVGGAGTAATRGAVWASVGALVDRVRVLLLGTALDELSGLAADVLLSCHGRLCCLLQVTHQTGPVASYFQRSSVRRQHRHAMRRGHDARPGHAHAHAPDTAELVTTCNRLLQETRSIAGACTEQRTTWQRGRETRASLLSLHHLSSLGQLAVASEPTA